MKMTVTNGIRHFLLALLTFLLVMNMAASCDDDDDDDDDEDSVTSVECNGETLSMGSSCQETYKAVIDCCADGATASENATTLICGMQANEDACKNGGATAADALCSLLAMRPECDEGGSDGDAGE